MRTNLSLPKPAFKPQIKVDMAIVDAVLQIVGPIVILLAIVLR